MGKGVLARARKGPWTAWEPSGFSCWAHGDGAAAPSCLSVGRGIPCPLPNPFRGPFSVGEDVGAPLERASAKFARKRQVCPRPELLPQHVTGRCANWCRERHHIFACPVHGTCALRLGVRGIPGLGSVPCQWAWLTPGRTPHLYHKWRNRGTAWARVTRNPTPSSHIWSLRCFRGKGRLKVCLSPGGPWSWRGSDVSPAQSHGCLAPSLREQHPGNTPAWRAIGVRAAGHFGPTFCLGLNEAATAWPLVPLGGEGPWGRGSPGQSDPTWGAGRPGSMPT